MESSQPTIKAGYKQTDVGIIPEDWVAKEMRRIGNVIRGASPRPQGDPRYYGGHVPRLMVEDVTRDGKYVTPNVDFLTQEGAKKSRPCNAGTLTIVCSGTVGIPSFLAVDACIHDGFLALIDIDKKISEDYLFHQLTMLKERFESSATHGGVFTNLTTAGVKEFKIPLPPTKEEQQAIAEVLSDMDALITSLDQLINKKRDIKQGTMQRLLTDKKTENWREISLFELADKRKELFDDGDWIEAEFLTDEGIRLIQTGNIGKGVFLEKENKKYISPESFKLLRCKEVNQNDVLICRLAEPAGRACIMPNIGEAKVITSVDVTIFRPLETFADRRLLVNIFNTEGWFNIVNEKCGGSTRTRIARGELGKIKIKLPPLEEQQAIAQILSDMDTEIEALEKKREKYTAIKQGMMQELLTGKTRLI